MTDTEVKDVIARVLGRVAPEADLGTVDPDANLREELEIDSIDFLHLLIGLNEELDVDIPESDYGQLTTLNEIASYVSARVEA